MGIPQVQNARRFQGPINWLFGENKVLHWSSGCSHWYLQDGLDFCPSYVTIFVWLCKQCVHLVMHRLGVISLCIYPYYAMLRVRKYRKILRCVKWLHAHASNACAHVWNHI
jgi:hypothetical protein